MAGGKVKVFGPNGEWPVPGLVEFAILRRGGASAAWKAKVRQDGMVEVGPGRWNTLESLAATHFQQLPVDAPPESLEHQRARHEGERIAAADSYFKARPHLDTVANRRLFEAGFDRGAA